MRGQLLLRLRDQLAEDLDRWGECDPLDEAWVQANDSVEYPNLTNICAHPPQPLPAPCNQVGLSYVFTRTLQSCPTGPCKPLPLLKTFRTAAAVEQIGDFILVPAKSRFQ
jgi:hypothetical protein